MSACTSDLLSLPAEGKEGSCLASLCFMSSCMWQAACVTSYVSVLCVHVCVSGTRAALLLVEAAVRKAAAMSLRGSQALGWARGSWAGAAGEGGSRADIT